MISREHVRACLFGAVCGAAVGASIASQSFRDGRAGETEEVESLVDREAYALGRQDEREELVGLGMDGEHVDTPA